MFLGGYFFGGMLFFDGWGGCGIDGFVDFLIEVGDFFGCGVDVDFYMLRLFVRGDKCGVGLFFGMI